MQNPWTIYHLDHPSTGETVILGGSAYLWASLFGPLYVLRMGFGRSALGMLGISLALTLAAAIAFGFVAVIGGSGSDVIVLIAIPLVMLLVQGVVAVRMVRMGYLRLGWHEG